MKIGVPRETKDNEYRVGMTPDGAAEAVLGDKPTVRKQAVAWINTPVAVGVPALVAALRHVQADRRFDPGMRQLVHVGFSVVAAVWADTVYRRGIK